MSEIVKEASISKEEATALRREMRLLNTSDEVMGRVLQELTEQAAEKRQQYWDDIARRLGYEDHMDADLQGVTLRLDWVSCKLSAEKCKKAVD